VTQLAISAARQKCRSQLIEFDQTTMANMTAALDAVCKRIPPEKDSHEVRKRIADAMVACAKSGRRTLVISKTSGRKLCRRLTGRRVFIGSVSDDCLVLNRPAPPRRGAV
jgi:hypothetical protein